MSGHSKWHNIRLRKGKMDAVRGKAFTRLARDIIVAAKGGGGNPDANIRLRYAIQKAREASMPADNIKRAIQRGTGEIEGVTYEEITYEGYGPGGVAVLVQCMTDNKQRTVSDVRSYFTKTGGRLGETGSVNYLFTAKGVIEIEAGAADEDKLMDVAIEAGAEDVQPTEEGGFEITTEPGDLNTVQQALETAGIAYASAEATMIPLNTVHVEGKEAQQVLRLIDLLEENDDVQNVYANFDIPVEELEAAEA
jgi:YebC/PmpR family DNA-binding regulatory protein